MGQAVIGISRADVAVAVASGGIPAYRLGSIGGYDDPTLGYQEFVYGQAKGAVTGLGYVCVETTLFDYEMVTVTNTAPGAAGFGSRIGVAQAAIVDNGFGWFQIYGKGTIRTANAAAIGTRLNSTATPGAVDDDGTASSEAIFGLVLQTATAGAVAGPDAVMSYPTVGTTL